MMMRQGDLLIVRVNNIPEGAEKQDHRVLAEGEATGHMHELDSGTLYEKDGTLYFSVTEKEKKSTLNHQEHAALTFAPGKYKVIRQREYSPENWDSWRYVSD